MKSTAILTNLLYTILADTDYLRISKRRTNLLIEQTHEDRLYNDKKTSNYTNTFSSLKVFLRYAFVKTALWSVCSRLITTMLNWDMTSQVPCSNIIIVPSLIFNFLLLFTETVMTHLKTRGQLPACFRYQKNTPQQMDFQLMSIYHSYINIKQPV